MLLSSPISTSDCIVCSSTGTFLFCNIDTRVVKSQLPSDKRSHSLGSVPLPLPPSDSWIAIFVLNLPPVIVPSPVTSPFQASLIPSFDIRQQSSITFI